MKNKFIISISLVVLLGIGGLTWVFSPTQIKSANPEQTTAQRLVSFWKAEWSRTDFSQKKVPLEEIVSGGPSRDIIPPIDEPKFEKISSAKLHAEEPVLVFSHKGETKAYPLQILLWHEIVNDIVGGEPVVITYCPLCNSALVFDRVVEGKTLDFGTTGKLRNSDLVMWDRQSESWWQQITGEGIVGHYSGKSLRFLPSFIVSFSTFSKNFPEAKILSRDTGKTRNYGFNPYQGYDNPGIRQPFMMRNPASDRLPAMERVVGVMRGEKTKAYAFSSLKKQPVINDKLGGTPLVVVFVPDTLSILDNAKIANSTPSGSAVAFHAVLGEKTLTFSTHPKGMKDKETKSLWTTAGEAISGPLKGSRLKPLIHANHFAFAWLAFYPKTEIWHPTGG